MARIRAIKPSFFMSRAVKRLNDKQKLVWIGLWPNADDDGRLLDEPGILVGQLWALSVTEAKLDQILTELDVAGRIIRYEVAGERFIQVTNWDEHQKISKPTRSPIPPVPASHRSRTAPGALPETSRGERKGKEGIGGGGVNDAEPPAFCPSHPTGTSTDCRACGDARRAHDAWLRAKTNAPTPIPSRTAAVGDHVHLWMPDGTCRFPGCIERKEVA